MMLTQERDALQDAIERRTVLRRWSIPSDFRCWLKTARVACTDGMVVPDEVLSARLLGAASRLRELVSLQDS